METYEESVELTRTFVKIESTNPGTEEAAMREAILAYLKDTSCEIQLDDVGNGRKNVMQKYKMHYNDTREDEKQGTQRCCIFHPPYLSEFWMRFADTE